MHCISESTTSEPTNNTISATGASNPLKMNEFCRLVLEFIYILTLFWSIQPPDEPFGVGGDAGYPRRRRDRPAGPETGSGKPKIASAEPLVASLGRSDAATGFSAKFGPGDFRHGIQRSKATANEAFNFFRVLKMPKKDPNFASSDTFLASWGNSEAAIGFRAKIPYENSVFRFRRQTGTKNEAFNFLTSFSPPPYN